MKKAKLEGNGVADQEPDLDANEARRAQPLFGGIVTALGGKRAGQAMGLNVFTLFVGFGLGSLGFGALLEFGFVPAFSIFASAELILGVLALALFRSELPARVPVTARTDR